MCKDSRPNLRRAAAGLVGGAERGPLYIGAGLLFSAACKPDVETSKNQLYCKA